MAKKRKRPVKNLFNKAKDKVKSATDKAKDKVKDLKKPLIKLVKKGVDAAKGAGQEALFAPLIPYTPLMRALIKKNGAKPERQISKLAFQFKSVVIDKSRFEEDFEYLEETPSIKTFNAEEDADEVTEETERKEIDKGNVAGSTLGALAGATIGLPPQAGGAAGSAIQNVIKAIVSWLRNLKNKKEAGKNLTPSEEAALKAGEKIDEATDQLNAATGGGGVFANKIDVNSLLMPILLVVVGFFVIKKFS